MIHKIKEMSVAKKRPDGTAYSSLSFSHEKQLVEQAKLSHKEIQILALQNDILPERYARNQKSLTNVDQLKLLNSRVAIVGLGGLGGTVTEILTRIGVGFLTLVDGDTFEDSNLNRQLLSGVNELGRMKAEVAAERILSLNPAVDCRIHRVFATKNNCRDLLRDADCAVDCLDTITDRFVLEDGCSACGIPMVSAAIGGSSGQVTVIYPGDQGLRQIYGDPDKTSRKGVEKKLGTLPYAAMTMAAIECAEITTLLIGKPAPLRDRLFITDLADHSVEIVDLQ